MTAFLFIPSTGGPSIGRRLDLVNIARLFSEIEEPAPRRDRNHAARVALLVIILLGAIGDTVLVARPGALMTAPTLHATPGRATTL